MAYFQLESNEKKQPSSVQDFVVLTGECLKTADSFYKLAYLGIKQGDSELILGSSVRASIAFSCELYLKALLYANQQFEIRTHELDELYEMLDSELEQEIYEMHPKGNLAEQRLPDYFYLQIKELRKAFTFFRYEHEWGSWASNIQFLIELADTLRIVAISKYKRLPFDEHGLETKELSDVPDFALCKIFALMGIYCCKVESRAFQLIYADLFKESR